jgi:hypothetical protein
MYEKDSESAWSGRRMGLLFLTVKILRMESARQLEDPPLPHLAGGE